MTLKNYWWLLIWMFLFGAISLVFIPRREEIVLGKPCVRWGKLSAAVLAIPYVVWAAWRPDGFGDTSVYRAIYRAMPTGLQNLPSYLSTIAKGKGFAFIEYLTKSYISSSDVVFFFIVAVVQISLIVHVYRKYSTNYWLSMFLFVVTSYLAWMHNGIRQFLAAAMIFGAFPLLVKRRYLLMTLIVIVAAQVHLSALVFLPFIFIVNGTAWNLRTILFMIGVLLAVFFLDEVTGLISDMMVDTAYEGIDILNYDNGTSIIRVMFNAIPTVAAFLFRDLIHRRDDPVINVSVNLSIVTTGVYVFSVFTSGILVGALPIFFSLANYILIPWLLAELFDKESGILMEGAVVALYSVYFYYQVGVTWHLL